MKIESALKGVSQIYLDTAPVIYYVQGVTPFFPVVDALFQFTSTPDCELIGFFTCLCADDCC
ncbi:MAG: hypothetical protein Fur0025_44240 [Oscillatoriaceae cyanobacterium]